MRRVFLTLLLVLSIVLLTVVDVSFRTAFGPSLSFINLPLFAAIYTMTILHPRIAFVIFMVSTIVTGLLASQFLLIPLLVGVLVLGFLHHLVETFFTNRSYYAVLSMSVLGWILYEGALAVVASIVLALTANHPLFPATLATFLVPVAIGLGTLIVLISLTHLLIVAFSKRLQSYFIVSGKTTSYGS